MSLAPRNARRFQFGSFEVDVETGELRKKGRKIRLQEKSFQILVALLEHHGSLVTRDELHQRLWTKDTFVDVDNGLNTAISKLRAALGDCAPCVETLARRGYRFVGRVDELGQSATTPARALLIELKQIEPDIAVVEIGGRIVLGPECQQIEWLISDLLRDQKKKIVFDLSGVSHVDSTGVGILVVSSAKVKEAGGELRIAGARGLVEHTLRITNVARIVALDPTTAVAVERFAV